MNETYLLCPSIRYFLPSRIFSIKTIRSMQSRSTIFYAKRGRNEQSSFFIFLEKLPIAERCTFVVGLDSVQFPETLVDFGTLALRQNFASEIIISRNPSETTRTKERSKIVVSELVARRILPFDGNPRCKPSAFSFPLIAFVPRIPRFLGFYYELTDRSLNIGSSTYVRVDIFVEISTKEKEAERDIVTINRSLRSYPADTVSTSSTSIFNEIQSLYLTRIDLSCKNHSTTFKRRICALGQHLSISKQYYLCVCDIFLTSRGLDPTFFSLSKVHEIEVIRTKSQPGLLLRNEGIRVAVFFFFPFFLFLFLFLSSFSRTNRASRDFVQNHRRRISRQSVTRQDKTTRRHDILKLISSIANLRADLFVSSRTRDYASTDSGKSKLQRKLASIYAKDVSNRNEVTKLSLTRYKVGRVSRGAKRQDRSPFSLSQLCSNSRCDQFRVN